MSLQETAGVVLAQAADAGSLMGLLPIVLMFAILYFLMIRPQMKRQKEHKALVAGLAKGDEVITAGGLLGRVTKVSDAYIHMEVAELADKPVEILVQRSAVQMVLPKGTIKAI
ncbi:preprotein translocase subunit YajC [Orrella marina]|uniref:Sec translocon accessory complex subunit YajC n=1 Tax=Orrella marina TaxID=2163011 RepID=A0A2R4XIR0_9BURK|nr:preprotein translocase subunit YajC [Orrella marina]AWB33685.1 preprotein translocase subunit YajC [Orrella marina]